MKIAACGPVAARLLRAENKGSALALALGSGSGSAPTTVRHDVRSGWKSDGSPASCHDRGAQGGYAKGTSLRAAGRQRRRREGPLLGMPDVERVPGSGRCVNAARRAFRPRSTLRWAQSTMPRRTAPRIAPRQLAAPKS
ncbi:hypothetical protein EGT86_27090 [Burkholderia pseudomallei]|nr:hypothetical protein EGT86_27090 [Burkholderia pseudomallei]